MTGKPDIIIRNGTVIDGTGAAAFQADVAISGGVITEIGKISAAGVEEIDAKGLLVTPGFVDIHTHYDGQATWDSRIQPSSFHGVTTVVMGNCGVGFAPARKKDQQQLVALMEGVEDIPEATLLEGLNWDWESFEQYLDVLDSRPHDIDIGAQLPHAALRVYVMGADRAMRLEAATTEDIAEMRKLAERAMRAGAVGFTTSRTINHQTLGGENTPSLRAMEEELTGIALGMKDAGKGVIELLSDFDTPDIETEFALLRRVVERSGRPMSFTAIGARPGVWRQQLAMVDAAVKDGVPMRLQVAPRSVGLLFNLEGSLHPFTYSPSYKEIAAKPLKEKLAIMRDASFRAKLIAEDQKPAGDEIVNPDADYRFKLARMARRYERMFRLEKQSDYEPSEAQSVESIARQKGVSPLEVIYDMLLEKDGRNFIYYITGSYADYNLNDYREMMAQQNSLFGLSDGGAHCGLICDASFPTFILSYWGRDRPEGRFELPWLINRLTERSARAVGMNDRGVIAIGKKADINIIDFERLNAGMPEMVYDLPAGGRRLLQKATGYVATIVSGLVTYRNGEATTALPGRLVRPAFGD